MFDIKKENQKLKEDYGITEDEAKQKQNEKQEKDEFVVDDDEKANWCLRKIRQKKEKIQEKEELADKEIMKLEKEIKEVEDWLEEETEKLKRDIENFEVMLYRYAEQLKEKNEDFKTKKLPFGKVQFRKQRPKWNYDNQKILDEMKEAGLENTSIVQVKEKVNKRELKAGIKSEECPLELMDNGKVVNTETGQVLESVSVKERGEKFKIKVKGE